MKQDEHQEDTDEFLALKRELVFAQAQLDQLRQRKASLVAMAAHDLRTPLAIIQGYAQLLAAELAPDAHSAEQEYITNIIAHTKSLANIVDNLVALDQVERGGLVLAVAPYNLNDGIGQALAQVEGLMVIKDLKVECRMPDEPLWINADESQIGRVFYNMLSHAGKYARPNGILIVEIDDEPSSPEVRITDPSRLLKDAALARLFDLVEIGGDEYASLRGSDLGLVISRHIVEAHGGTVSATSDPVHGTTLILSLPRS